MFILLDALGAGVEGGAYFEDCDSLFISILLALGATGVGAVVTGATGVGATGAAIGAAWLFTITVFSTTRSAGALLLPPLNPPDNACPINAPVAKLVKVLS